MKGKNGKRVKLTLHHNYLQIERDEECLQLPVRCAKIISDMYLARGAKNENEDLAYYSSEFHENFTYEVSVLLMGVKDNNSLQWMTKIIPPLESVKKVKPDKPKGG